MLGGVMPTLPSGTVTFVFSDIEGSTALLKRVGDARYAELLTRHRRLVREGFSAHGGQEIDTQGDAFFYSFPRARDAVTAAVEVQRAHATADWDGGEAIRVRMGLHTGEPAVGDEGYTGLDVVRAARIAAVAHGGQVLLSATTRALIGEDVPNGVAIHALGAQRLKDIDRPEPLHELRIDGGETDASPATSDAPVPASDAFDLSRFLPAWLRESSATIPGVDRARELIEQRVLGEIERAMADDSDEPEAPQPLSPGAPPSIATELDRLRELRDSGALSASQYERAVDRVLQQD
jgi:class 3 adenylate cyclase